MRVVSMVLCRSKGHVTRAIRISVIRVHGVILSEYDETYYVDGVVLEQWCVCTRSHLGVLHNGGLIQNAMPFPGIEVYGVV